MSIIPKKNDNDLTEAEVAFLRGNAPPEVKGYLSRQHDNIGTKVSAYRKVAAAARAECDALLAVQDLAAMHGELAHVAEANEKVKQLERRAQALESTVSAKDQRIMELTAGPAMAVHSGGD
jgi:hypothetical protein